MDCSCTRLLSNRVGPDQPNARALIRSGLHGCRTAPRLDDFFDHRKPDAGALNFVAWRQRLKDPPNPLVVFRIDPGTIVAHRKLERIPEIPPIDPDDYVRALDPGVFH